MKQSRIHNMKIIKIPLAPSTFRRINELPINTEQNELMVSNELLETKVYPFIIEFCKGNVNSPQMVTVIALEYNVKKLKLKYHIINMSNAIENKIRINQYIQNLGVTK